METLRSWFQLKSVPGIGNHLFKRLVDRFGSPLGALAASPDDLLTVEGINRRVVDAMRASRAAGNAAAEIDAAQRRGYRIVTLNDPDYPLLLREIPDPPPWLYVNGALRVERTLCRRGGLPQRHRLWRDRPRRAW